MPDPLLSLSTLADDFDQAQRVAGWFGASLSRVNEVVFLECSGSSGQSMLARIECSGYPQQPPLVEFLDPKVTDRLRMGGSSNPAHWPPGHGPMPQNGGYHLCLAGTRSYRLFHPDPGYVMGLGHLVSVLALACKGASLVR
jgi:hypothetical protein